MHVEAMTWANQHGSNGFVPDYALTRITDEPEPATAAAELVDAGLWEAVEGGWNIVDFLTDQPSAADVERTQARSRDRQRRQRQHRNGDHTLCDPRYCHASRVTDAVTNGVSHNTRPDPTRPGETGRGREGADERSASAPRPSSAPSRYGPPDGVNTTVTIRKA
jgi:hypothetical protein